MKLLGVVSTAVLFLIFGIAVPVYAQEQQQEENKPAQHEEAKPAQDRPSQQEEAKPGERREEVKPGERQEDVKPGERREEARPEERREETHPAVREQGEQHEHKAGGNRGGHIPDNDFRAHFRREHTFRIGQPRIIEGQPRFQYAGYWFVIVQPWPAEWAYTDDVYVDYVDDEYYLFDLMHPGIRIAINVIM